MPPERDEAPAVLAANRAFYDAFAAGDLEAMEEIWSRRTLVACVHPGWSELTTREQVMRSWEAILGGATRPHVTLESAAVTLLDAIAIVVCRERIDEPDTGAVGLLVATNVFVREGDAWRLVHHHSGPLASEDEDEDADAGDGDGAAAPPPKRVLN